MAGAVRTGRGRGTGVRHARAGPGHRLRKWNLDRVVDPAVNSPLAGQLKPPLEKVDVVDKTTVKLQSSIPWRPMLAALGERPGFIVSPPAAQKSGQDFGRMPVVRRPFRLV